MRRVRNVGMRWRAAMVVAACAGGNMAAIRPGVIALLVVLLGHQTAQAQTFDVVDLGSVPGFSTLPDTVNDHDQVAGVLAGLVEPDRLFLWDEVGGLQTLNAPHPISSASRVHINNAGHIVGLWTRAGADRPFLWNGSTFTELPDVAFGWVRSIRRFTDGGLVLYEGPAAGCNQLTAVLFAGTLYRVDQVLGSCWTARDVADGPVVAGYRLAGGVYQAAVRAASGQVTVHSTMPGAQVWRLGAGGHVAGTRGVSSHMFITDPRGGYAEFTPLPGNLYINPSAINAVGELVGHSSGGTQTSRPLLIRNRRITELRTIIPNLTMTIVLDINRSGHILADGASNGQGRAVLLKPNDRPHDLQASVAGNQATLTWAPPAGAPPGVSYLLQVGSSPGASNVLNANIGGGTSIGGTVPNGAYFARLSMVYPNGAYGGVSQELSFTVPTLPQAPTALQATLDSRRLTLTWTPPAGGGVVDYVAEAGSSPGGSNLYNGSVGSAAGLTTTVGPGTYHIRIRARNAAGLSAPSNEVMVVVP